MVFYICTGASKSLFFNSTYIGFHGTLNYMVNSYQTTMIFNLYHNPNQTSKAFQALLLLKYLILMNTQKTSRLQCILNSKAMLQDHNTQESMQLYIENAVHIIMQEYFHIFLLEFLCSNIG